MARRLAEQRERRNVFITWPELGSRTHVRACCRSGRTQACIPPLMAAVARQVVASARLLISPGSLVACASGSQTTDPEGDAISCCENSPELACQAPGIPNITIESTSGEKSMAMSFMEFGTIILEGQISGRTFRLGSISIESIFWRNTRRISILPVSYIISIFCERQSRELAGNQYFAIFLCTRLVHPPWVKPAVN